MQGRVLLALRSATPPSRRRHRSSGLAGLAGARPRAAGAGIAGGLVRPVPRRTPVSPPACPPYPCSRRCWRSSRCRFVRTAAMSTVPGCQYSMNDWTNLDTRMPANAKPAALFLHSDAPSPSLEVAPYEISVHCPTSSYPLRVRRCRPPQNREKPPLVAIQTAHPPHLTTSHRIAVQPRRIMDPDHAKYLPAYRRSCFAGYPRDVRRPSSSGGRRRLCRLPEHADVFLGAMSHRLPVIFGRFPAFVGAPDCFPGAARQHKIARNAANLAPHIVNVERAL
jgi:hypothetical protein